MTSSSCPSCVQLSERVLHLWSLRHPGSGYVQGINDLLAPLLYYFLAGQLLERNLSSCAEGAPSSDEDLLDHGFISSFDVTKLPDNCLDDIEADCFWCLSKLVDNLHENYTAAQPGIQTAIFSLTGLIRRIDPPLYLHLEKEGVQFVQFSFRWMNCLLLREVCPHSIPCNDSFRPLTLNSFPSLCSFLLD